MDDEFARLQSGLAEVWPALTLRSHAATPKTNVVVHSLSNDPPAHLAPIGRRLAREGAIGRFAVDFVTVRDAGGPWRSYAIEINLRCGGTTATYFALQALTDAAYDPESAQLISAGQPKYYVASHHLAGDDYRTLIPDDLLDLIDAGALGWNAERQTGVAFHMLSSLAVAGFVGATAIGNTPEEARAAYDHTRDVLSTTSVREHYEHRASRGDRPG